MSFEPDILVTAPDSPRILLVVEAKYRLKDISEIESPLKRYMVKMGAPVGLLISPESIAIYRDRYIRHSEQSVERIGLFKLPRSHHLSQFSLEQAGRSADARAALAFEESVQNWLERLQATNTLDDFSPEASDAISEYVLPALHEGEIRAAHPRENPGRAQ